MTFSNTYRFVYRRIGWLIQHAGPLAPLLTRAAVGLHDRLIPKSVYVRNPVQVDGLVVYHEGLPVAARSLATGMYEIDTVHLLKRTLRAGITMLDVGANIGYFSLIAGRLVGRTGAVWAFEPVKQNLALLEKNVSVNGLADCIHIVPMAVTDQSGVRRLYINSASMGLSSLNEEASTGGQHTTPAQQEVAEVACVSLDEWAEEHGWPPVELVKIDVEGAETEVLAGMVQLSRRNKGVRVIVEFNVRTLSAANQAVADFFDALRLCGLEQIYAIGPKMRLLNLPTDVPWLLRELRRHGGESANLLCMSRWAAKL